MLFDKELQKLEIPDSFTLVHHDFYAYDPAKEYQFEANVHYLGEDLFQVIHEPTQLVVDLGWYGNRTENKGGFVLNVIRNEFWDEPVSKIHETSQKQIAEVLNRTLFAIHSGIMG
jgi:hypothetical protein